MPVIGVASLTDEEKEVIQYMAKAYSEGIDEIPIDELRAPLGLCGEAMPAVLRSLDALEVLMIYSHEGPRSITRFEPCVGLAREIKQHEQERANPDLVAATIAWCRRKPLTAYVILLVLFLGWLSGAAVGLMAFWGLMSKLFQ